MLETKDVRTLKGAALSILILGLLDPQPHNAAWFERMSGYTDKPVTQALKLLVEYDYMLKSPNGWGIATDQQLKLSTGYPQENRNNSDSGDLVVSSLIKDSIKDLKELTTTTTRDSGNRNNSEMLKATCLELGIKDPKASQIAQLDITPEYIRAHVASVDDLALAIYRITHGWKEPRSKSKVKVCYTCGEEFLPDSKYQESCDDCLNSIEADI